MLEMVDKLEQRLAWIDEQMILPENLANQKQLIQLQRERRQLEDTLVTGRRYREVVNGISEAKEIIRAENDPDMIAMAKEELAKHEADVADVTEAFRIKLLPKDPNDSKTAIVEIRAGTGGDEAAIFVGDIFRMYSKYIDMRGWKLEILSSSDSGMGGFKEIIFSLDGDDAYGTMKYESGVHRVQRVPDTETQGRIHTSAISVVVLPEAEEVDIQIKDSEIKIDVYRSSGPGGQSVNTTDSAVRITHLPTNLVVTCQDEKSQLKNKQKALKVLRTRLLDIKIAEQQAKMSAERKTMVVTGDRSAKIRTYNYPQSRVTDHRIGLTIYQLESFMEGEIGEMIEALRRHDQEERLKFETSALAS